MASLFAASPGEGWVFAAHDVLAFALAGLLVVKRRRVWRRWTTPAEWDRLVKPGVLATVFVAAALVSGWVWSGGGRVSLAGFTLLSWHLVLGWTLAAAVAVHAFVRRRRMRVRDAADRRQFLVAAGGLAGAGALWRGGGPPHRGVRGPPPPPGRPPPPPGPALLGGTAPPPPRGAPP